MTAVAVLQETAIRKAYSHVYWVTVGADAVGDKIRMLQGQFHKQLTGKSTSREEALARDGQEWQQMLVTAMAEKQRALLVLDDPWMPEQVRALSFVAFLIAAAA